MMVIIGNSWHGTGLDAEACVIVEVVFKRTRGDSRDTLWMFSSNRGEINLQNKDCNDVFRILSDFFIYSWLRTC